MGFASRLPTLTQLAAPPDARVRLEKVEDLPIADPRGSVTADLAFRIHIPLVPPKAKLNFTLWTDDENNKRACQQLARIYEMRRAVLSDFFRSILKAGSAKPKEIPNLDVLFAAIAKSEALFQPDAMSSERGRRAVLFISEAESRSLELLGAAYRSFKRRFIEVFKNRGECMAPVFTVEQTGGRSATFAVFPPDIRTYITGAVRLPAVEETAEVAVRPVPPKNYACSP